MQTTMVCFRRVETRMFQPCRIVRAIAATNPYQMGDEQYDFAMFHGNCLHNVVTLHLISTPHIFRGKDRMTFAPWRFHVKNSFIAGNSLVWLCGSHAQKNKWCTEGNSTNIRTECERNSAKLYKLSRPQLVSQACTPRGEPLQGAGAKLHTRAEC